MTKEIIKSKSKNNFSTILNHIFTEKNLKIWEKSFLEWFNSFNNYLDEKQNYWLNNNKYIEFTKEEEYIYQKTRERVIFEILKEKLWNDKKYLLTTEYDDFKYWIDLIIFDKKDWNLSQKLWLSWKTENIIWIDVTVNTEKEIKHRLVKPIDFYRSKYADLETRKNWIQRIIMYFDSYSINKTIANFIESLKNWKKIYFSHIYFYYLSMKEEKEDIQDKVLNIIE